MAGRITSKALNMSSQAPALHLLAGGLSSPSSGPSVPSGNAEGAGVAFETLLAAQQIEVSGQGPQQITLPESLNNARFPSFFTTPQQGAANENATGLVAETLIANQPAQTTADITGSVPPVASTEPVATTTTAESQINPSATTNQEAAPAPTAQTGTNNTSQNSAQSPVQITHTDAAVQAPQGNQTTTPETVNVETQVKTVATTAQNNITAVTPADQPATSQTTGLSTNVEQNASLRHAPGADNQVQTTAKATTVATTPQNNVITPQSPQEATPTPKAETQQPANTTNQTNQPIVIKTAESQILATQGQSLVNTSGQQTRAAQQNLQAETEQASTAVKVKADGTIVKKSSTGKPANSAANQNTQKAALTLVQNAPLSFDLAGGGTLQPLEGQDGQILPQQTSELSIQAARTAGTMQVAPGIRVPVNLIAVNIAQHASQGVNKFELRLDPPELGRIEVKMEMASDGKVTAHIAAERAETLDLLQRDARALERALNETGLSADRDSLSFSLKDQAFKGDQNQQDQQQNAANNDDTDTIDHARIAKYRAYINPDSVDIRI